MAQTPCNLLCRLFHPREEAGLLGPWVTCKGWWAFGEGREPRRDVPWAVGVHPGPFWLRGCAAGNGSALGSRTGDTAPGRLPRPHLTRRSRPSVPLAASGPGLRNKAPSHQADPSGSPRGQDSGQTKTRGQEMWGLKPGPLTRLASWGLGTSLLQELEGSALLQGAPRRGSGSRPRGLSAGIPSSGQGLSVPKDLPRAWPRPISEGSGRKLLGPLGCLTVKAQGFPRKQLETRPWEGHAFAQPL